MNTSTPLCTRQVSLRFCAWLLALMGLLLLGARSSQAEEVYFNTLNPKTGAIVKSWKIENFSWETSQANQTISAFTMMWSENAASAILLEAESTSRPIAAASLTFYKNGKRYLTYKFTDLQVTSLLFSSSANGSDTPIESATLTFEHVAVFY